MGTELDLDDVASVSKLAMRELTELRKRLVDAENLLRFLSGIHGNEVDLLSLREEARNHFRRYK